MEIILAKTEKNYDVDVPEEVATELAGVLTALAGLSVNTQANVDFAPADYPDKDGKPSTENAIAAARLFARQGRSWAAATDVKFVRKGDISGNPTRVTFRVYKSKDSE